jgi:hypothetical protein
VCPAPKVFVAIGGAADSAAAAKLRATLESNLGALLASKVRLEGLAESGSTVAGNASSVTDIKAACILVVTAAANGALGDVAASASASASVIAAVGGS